MWDVSCAIWISTQGRGAGAGAVFGADTFCQEPVSFEHFARSRSPSRQKRCGSSSEKNVK